MKKLLIYGAGDQGIVTLDSALAMKEYSKIDFLDIKEKGRRQIPGYSIYKEAEENLKTLLQSYDEVIVATGNNQLRQQKHMILTSMNIPLATIIHPAAVVSPSATVGAHHHRRYKSWQKCNRRGRSRGDSGRTGQNDSGQRSR